MPENIKWELVSFALKVAPVLLGLLFAWIAVKLPSTEKALNRLRPFVGKAFNIVNQTFVEPMKAGGKFDDEAKEKARQEFWAKFVEIATEEANYWLDYLLLKYGETAVQRMVVGNELHDEMQLIKQEIAVAPIDTI